MILSHPGTYVDWEHCYRKCSSRSDDKDRCRSVIDKMSKSCEDIPVDSYGKVVLCGNSGAGKSTLTKVSKGYMTCRQAQSIVFNQPLVLT